MRFIAITLTLLLCLAVTNIAGAQPQAILKVIGASDREVAADTMDIFTAASSGLPNIGLGEIVYLAGNPGDTAITSRAWELQTPENSEAALNADDAETVSFTPDIVGTYTATLTVTSDEGESEPVSMAINAGTWVGIGGIVEDPRMGQCAMCHRDHVSEWAETGHATMFIEGINGVKSDYYNASCIRCHTVGFNTGEGAANNGFDDIAADEGWEFPDSLMEGNWEAMLEEYPRSAEMANIQCETCHGPGSAHNGAVDANQIAFSMTNDVCAKCHDSGSHYTRPYQWKFSGHAHTTTYPSGEGREGCVRCHTGYGFVDYVNGVPEEERRTEYLEITCATCHDPHDATNEHQLRTLDAYTLENGVEIDFGYGNLCVTCHHSRRNAEEYVQEYHRHYGPHHSNQADMVRGTNAIEYDEEIAGTPHYMALGADNVCVACHMGEGPGEEEPGHLQLGDHSFAMRTAEGIENVAACARCHGEIESFESFMADEDWDGDGEAEAVVAEIEGMMEELALLLPPAGEPEVEVTETYTAPQLKAAYNYFFVEDDGSHGLHNAGYARGILEASLADRENLGADPVEEPLPHEWSLGTPYPNPFNPTASLSYSVARSGLVSIKLFAVDGREVTTIVNGFRQPGEFRATINLTDYPSGIYMIRLEAEGFQAFRKALLVR